MIQPSYRDIQAFLAEYTHIPIAVRAAWHHAVDPFEVLQKLSPQLTGAVLLESGRAGRYTYLAYDPIAVIQSKHRCTTIQESGGHTEVVTDENPLHTLRRYMEQYRTPRMEQLPDFTGGAIGYLSYDLNEIFEPTVANDAVDDLQLPICML